MCQRYLISRRDGTDPFAAFPRLQRVRAVTIRMHRRFGMTLLYVLYMFIVLVPGGAVFTINDIVTTMLCFAMLVTQLLHEGKSQPLGMSRVPRVRYCVRPPLPCTHVIHTLRALPPCWCSSCKR